jgi:hypothetical protein
MASRTSTSVLPTRLLAVVNPRRSGTVSKSQTITLPFMGANIATTDGRREGHGHVQMPDGEAFSEANNRKDPRYR